MSVATRDSIINALGNASINVLWDKVQLTGQVVGGYSSTWLMNGKPSAGAIPSAVAACSQATQGAIKFTNPTAPAESYLMYHTLLTSVAGTSLEIHDRLAHMGGLSGTVITAQTVNLDVSALSLSAARIGATDFSDLTWWLEWYTATGATAVTASVAVTFSDGTTGTISGISIPATTGASRAIPITNNLTGASAGKSIKIVTSVTLSASTLTAGNFGVSVSCQRTAMYCGTAAKTEVYDWARLGLPKIADDACLIGYMVPANASTGSIRGQGKIGQV